MNLEFKISYILIGICLGSFSNVVRYRLPAKESLITPSSYCNNCKKTLNWYDNIPILSWIIINGKCRFCNWPIPLSYPLVELTLGLIFALNCQALSYTKEETFTKLIGISIFSTICFIASLIDLDLMIIPNSIILFGSIIGLSYNTITASDYNLLTALKALCYFAFSGCLGFILLEIATFLIALIIKKQAFGFGDSKYLFFIGSWLGIKGMLLGLVLAIYIGGAISIFLIALRVIRRKQKIPFGPYLSIGSYLVYLLGENTWARIFKAMYLINYQ